MAPIKFENDIKEKLDGRTLQPSQGAWSQLSSRLDNEKKHNSRSLFLYVGIAASIVGVLLVTAIFFKGAVTDNESATIVKTKVKEASDVEQENSINLEVSEQVIANGDPQINHKKENENTTIVYTNSSTINQKNDAVISEEKTAIQPEKQKISIKDLGTSEAIATVDKKYDDSTLNELTFEEAKAIEVVAEIKKLEIKNGEVTDAEIETLLKQAEKDILRQRIYDETTRTVDADALLQDVEEDLERSFRTRVFESLKSSYKTVKTAVAERNN